MNSFPQVFSEDPAPVRSALVPDPALSVRSDLCPSTSEGDDKSISNHFLESLVFPNSLSTRTFVFLVIFCAGSVEITFFTLYNYHRNSLQLSSERIQIGLALTVFFFMLKPAFKLALDAWISHIRYPRILVAISNLLKIIITCVLLFKRSSATGFYLGVAGMFLVGILEEVACEFMLICSTKRAKKRFDAVESNHLVYLFTVRRIGNFLGNWVGSLMISRVSSKTPYVVANFVSLIPILLCLFYHERPILKPNFEVTIRTLLRELPKLVCQYRMVGSFLIVMLAILTPNIDLIVAGFAIVQFNFSNKNIANTFNFGIFFYLLGLYLYQKVFQKLHPKAFYSFLLLLFFVVNLAFVAMVSDNLSIFGVSKGEFMTVFGGAQTFISSLMILPLITVWCRVCPEGLETYSIAIITSFGKCSIAFAAIHGSVAGQLLGVVGDNSPNLWRLVCYQMIFLIVAAIGFWLVPFSIPPKPSAMDAMEKLDIDA